MSALSIQVPFPVFNDRDGQPLDNGYVWIGVPNLPPQTNPVNVYFDEGLTILAPQPLRTINGYISRAGSPAQVYIDGVNFSILVQDSKGSMVYNFPDGTGISPDACGVTYDPPFTGGVPYPVCEKLAQTVSVKDFGAVGDGVADDTVAFQTALNNADGEVFVPPGQYNLSAKLTFPSKFGVALIGEGESRQSANPYPCVLRFNHVGSAAVQIFASGQSLQNLVIRAVGSRQIAPLDTVSFGVLVEGPDTVSGSPANCSVKNVFIEGHPSHGYVEVGPTFMNLLEGVAVRDCRGHAFILDDGTLTGRTNKDRPGGLIAQHLRTFKNGGHDFVTGPAGTFGPYRILIQDADFDSAGARGSDIDPSIKLANTCAVFHGENIVTMNCAFGGRVSGVRTYRGIQFSGRTHRYIANRYVGVTGVASAVEDATISTDDILFDGVYITSDSTASPAISITGTIGNISVLSPMAAGAGVLGVGANWFTSGYNKGFVLGDGRLILGNKTVSPLIIGNTGITSPGTVQQDGNVISGTYTPTLTGVTNVDTATAQVCQYMRVGNVVTVSGSVTVAATTATGTFTNCRISLPIASNLGVSSECSGVATHVDSSVAARNTYAKIIGDSTNDAALLQFSANTTLNCIFFFTFTYRVK